VRGEAKLICTLHESPAAASLHSATPKRKNAPYFSDFRGGGFFLKWKGHFSFWGSAFQVFRHCGEAKCGRGQANPFFSRENSFALPRLFFQTTGILYPSRWALEECAADFLVGFKKTLFRAIVRLL